MTLPSDFSLLSRNFLSFTSERWRRKCETLTVDIYSDSQYLTRRHSEVDTRNSIYLVSINLFENHAHSKCIIIIDFGYVSPHKWRKHSGRQLWLARTEQDLRVNTFNMLFSYVNELCSYNIINHDKERQERSLQRIPNWTENSIRRKFFWSLFNVHQFLMIFVVGFYWENGKQVKSKELFIPKREIRVSYQYELNLVENFII